MNLQYISDKMGHTTAVQIPIEDWELMKLKYKELQEEEDKGFDVPEWQKDIVLERKAYYDKHPEELLDWEEVKKTIKLG